MTGKRDICIGVIGVGGRGILSRILHDPAGGVFITAGCDNNADALKGFRDYFGPGTFVTDNYRELTGRDDIDAVVVTTPDYLHEEHTVAALEAGKSVYCEKPLAITIKGADNILTTARDYKQKLFVGHNMRYMPFVIKMKELVDSGAIGEIRGAWCRHFISYGGDAYFKDWHSEQKYTGGLLLQKGVHDIDVIHWICGSYTRKVSGFGNLTVYDQCLRRRETDSPDVSWHLENWPPLEQKNLSPAIDVEDHSMMMMKMGNGVLASYMQCHYTPDAWRNYTFIGTEGRIENFGDFTGGSVIRLWNKRTHYSFLGDEEFIIEADTGSHGGADEKIMQDFIRYVRGESLPATSPVAARNSVAAASGATESIRNGGRPVSIPDLDSQVAAYF